MKTKGRRDHQREPVVPGASTISLKHRTEILTRQKHHLLPNKMNCKSFELKGISSWSSVIVRVSIVQQGTVVVIVVI